VQTPVPQSSAANQMSREIARGIAESISLCQYNKTYFILISIFLLSMMMIFVVNILIVIYLIKFVDCQIYCEKGTFCSIGACLVCPTGTSRSYSTAQCNSGGNDKCEVCPVGTYQCMKNSTSCNLCEAGKYNPQIGSSLMSSCISCPENTFSNEGAGVCIPCPIGFGSKPESSKCEPVGNFMLNVLMFILLFLLGLVLYISYMIIYKRHEIDRSYVALHTAEPQQRQDIEMTNTN